MKKIIEKSGSILKKVFNSCKLYVTRHPLISIILAGVVVAVIVFIVIFYSVAPESGNILEDQYWKENEDGYRYYDREGYDNLLGIDISEWTEDFDFKAFKESGMDFVILRVGYRGYETGKFVLDNNLADYLKGAKDAGLKIGAYFVSQAVNEEEAVEEVEYILEHVKGYDLEMPVYIDLENVYDEARTDHLGKEDYTRIIEAFCNRVEEEGYTGGIYANEYWFYNLMDFDKINKYDIWLAKYDTSLSTELPINMWQYSQEGFVEGTDLWVDLDTRVIKTGTEDN